VRIVRVTAGLLVLVGATLLIGHASTTPASTPALCRPSALASAYHSRFGTPLRYALLQHWGCRGDFAYADTIIGVASDPVKDASQLIEVTDVLTWRADQRRWTFLDRQWACQDTYLPDVIFRRGCFSN
jgi:hypothetical protein